MRVLLKLGVELLLDNWTIGLGIFSGNKHGAALESRDNSKRACQINSGPNNDPIKVSLFLFVREMPVLPDYIRGLRCLLNINLAL